MASPVVVVHDLAHAAAALAAAAESGVAVTLRTAPGAAAYAGSAYLKAVVDAAAEACPKAAFRAVIDCGDDAGHALGALRIGWQQVEFSGPDDVFDKLADIAGRCGAAVVRPDPGAAALDLLDAPDAAAACRRHLGRFAGRDG